MKKISENLWGYFITPDLSFQFRVKSKVLSRKTKFQQIEIIDTPVFGRCLIIDGEIQSSELDEFIYHEALVHPPLILHPCPQSVFIAGGGEGAVLREVVAYNTVKQVVMVDIDEEVINISKEFLVPWHQGAFQDKRVKLHFLDARDFLNKTEEKYDVIILDLTSPLIKGSPCQLLFTLEFYHLVKERLKENGIASLQAGATQLTNFEIFTAIVNTLRRVFPIVAPYHTDIPSFGGDYGFVLASQTLDPLKISSIEINNRISKRVQKKTSFYDGFTHQGIFSIPKYLRERINKEERIITDHNPLIKFRDPP